MNHYCFAQSKPNGNSSIIIIIIVDTNIQAEAYRFLRLQMNHLWLHPAMPTSSFFNVTKPVKSKLGMDHIYVISLRHRENRRRSIQHVFDRWGIDAEFFDAVDGKKLTEEDVRKYKMEKCRDYRHYTTDRDLTFGEVRFREV